MTNKAWCRDCGKEYVGVPYSPHGRYCPDCYGPIGPAYKPASDTKAGQDGR